MELAEKRYEQWLAQQGLEPELRTELDTMQSDAEKITDAFYRDLEFGTAGLRGVLGAGTNRMNVYVIRRATQAVAQYLNETDLPKTVAIGHDSRIKSDVFAREAAAVFAANGITAYLYPRLEPVPALSFAVRHLHCGLGVCVTASHNPAEYNGYKVYGADGCQMTPEAAKRVVALLEHMDTPLNGAGLECVKKLTQKLGIRNMTIVKEQEQPDGHFPTCPYPNPEIRQAMELGLQYCDRVRPDILIGTDPDCDRCGTAVPDGKGGYRLISGNEMGVILLDFICRSRIANGTMPENPVAVTTIVSTDMVTAVAKKYGVELRRVLTGFKYIGEQIALLEQGGHPERYIFGFEESYGYLSGTHARDKDAVNAVLLICEAAAWYAKKGMTLGDAIDALYTEFGCYCNMQKSFAFTGETGMEKMAGLMQGLRKQPLREIAGLPVEGYTDYEAEGTGLPKANVLEYRLPGGDKVIIRPSGTEPKIKAYLSAVKPTVEESNAQLSLLAEAAAKLLA